MKNCLLHASALLMLAATAGAEVHNFIFPLDGNQTVPITGAPGTGLGNVTYDDVTNELSWFVTYEGLIGDVLMAHFHGPAAPGLIGPVVVTMPVSDSPLVGNDVLTSTEETDLLAGLYYINIHTTEFGLGEIRGQVVDAGPVPSASTVGLLALAGLLVGAAALVIRRRQGVAALK